MITKFLKKFRSRYIGLKIGYFLLIEAVLLLTVLAFSSLLIIPYYYLLPLLIIPMIFFRLPGLKEIANIIEQDYPDLKDKLIIGYQFEQGDFEKQQYSQELIAKTIVQIGNTLDQTTPKPTIKPKRWQEICTISAVFFFFLIAIWSPNRLLFNLNPDLKIIIDPRGGTFTKDSLVHFHIQTFGSLIPKDGRFHFSGTQKTSLDVDLSNGKGTVQLPIRQSGTISFTALRKSSPNYSIQIEEPTVIDSILTVVHFPNYTDLSILKTKDHSIAVITGSQVIITPYATPHQDVRLTTTGIEKTINSGESIDLSIKENRKIVFETKGGIRDSITITCLQDLAPSIVIFYPGQDIDLPKSMKLNLGIRLTDDFKIIKSSLNYKFKGRDKVAKLFSFTPTHDETISYTWDLAKIDLLPGDTVEYWVSAFDHRQKGMSRRYKIYFPTMTQIYDEITSEEKDLRDLMSDIRTKIDQDMKTVDDIKEDFLRKRELNWSELTELKKIVESNRSIKDMIQEWRQEWVELAKKMAKTKVVDPDVVSRIKEITKLLSEIAPEQLDAAMEKLKKQSAKNPERFNQKLDEMLENQEQFKESLDRAIEILKRFQQEEYLKQLKDLAEKLATREEELVDQLEKEEESAVSASREIDKGVVKLKNMMTIPPQGLPEENRLKRISQLADSLQIENLAGRQKGEILDKQWEDAKLTSKELSQYLNQIRSDLKAMYQETIAKRAKEVKERILRRIEQLVKLSHDQEKILNGHPDPINYEELIKKNITAIAESIVADRKLSVHVPVSAGILLANAINDLEQVIKYYQSGIPGRAERYAQRGMGNINLTVNHLFAALNNLMKSSSPSGLDAFQQKLNSIAQQQQNISQALSKLMPIPMTGMSAQLRSKMKSLGQKQRALRKEVEKYAATSELARNISKQMKSIEEDLFNYRIDRKLIERQKKLITRLLDAERSIRKDKLDKKRISEVAGDITKESPDSPILERPDLLREMIMKELRGDYPLEYQHYIRLYYQMLLEER